MKMSQCDNPNCVACGGASSIRVELVLQAMTNARIIDAALSWDYMVAFTIEKTIVIIEKTTHRKVLELTKECAEDLVFEILAGPFSDSILLAICDDTDVLEVKGETLCALAASLSTNIKAIEGTVLTD